MSRSASPKNALSYHAPPARPNRTGRQARAAIRGLIRPHLVTHLEKYGIRHFKTDDYWQWARECLGKDLARKTDRLRSRALADKSKPPAVTQPSQPRPTGRACKCKPPAVAQPSRARSMDRLRFYNWIARPEISAVMHSMKAGAIAASGAAVAARLSGARRILDLGCATGYLTTWYALEDPRREVTGVDFSGESVIQARRMARRLGVRNAKFARLNPARGVVRATYDVLVDTQTLQDLEDLDRVFARLARLLRPGGFLLSVPALATARDAKRFLRSMSRGGFAIRSCDFIFFSDCGIPSAYPVITASLGEETIELDFARLYQEILDALTRPCYPNL